MTGGFYINSIMHGEGRMLRNRLLWTGILMPGSLAGWAFVIAGLFLNFTGIVGTIWLVMLVIWMVAHPLEIIMSYGIGRAKNIPPAMIAVKTILFGFTWWLPLKMGVIGK